MKHLLKIFAMVLMTAMVFYVPAFAQGGMGGHGGMGGGGYHGGGMGGHGGGMGGHGGGMGGGYMHPDSLTPVTVSGTAIVDSSMMMTMYYLDEDGDGQADFHLNFGPWWYQPDSSNAVRPLDGDVITIYGGLNDSTMMTVPAIVVYEINGEFWREPFNPTWHHNGGHGHGHGHGWMNDTLQTIAVNGTALVDTTFMMNQYFLDEDGNGTPDYRLNFGPWWYQPASGATRPNDGDQIDILGGLFTDSLQSIIIVYEIDGLVWRDSTLSGHTFGGGWIHRNMMQAYQIQAPFDPQDMMQINPGWHNGGGGHQGGMMPDSLYCEMLQMYPQNMPNITGENSFAGYEFGMYDAQGNDMMMQNGHMSFASGVDFQLHYSDVQLQGFNIDESSITAKYWDEQSATWLEAAGAVVDVANNTVSFSKTDVSNYLILTGTQLTGITGESQGFAATSFTLDQNYPNPFNPSTTISFTLQQSAQVNLNIYNVVGQQVATLLNGSMEAGAHSLSFDAAALPSGIYFYELKVAGSSKVMKMNLMK